MDEYPFYCEIGIAVAITIVQMIIDNRINIRISNELIRRTHFDALFSIG